MKTSEVFKRVRAHLREYAPQNPTHTRYLCYAIEYLYYHTKVIGDRDRTRCLRIVNDLLGTSHTLEDWLNKNHGVKLTYTKNFRQRMHITRKAWLTHIIQHYQSKGD